MKHSVSGGENSKLIGLDVRVKSEIEKQWNEFKMSSNNDDAKAGIVVPDEITGSGKDELEQLFVSYDIRSSTPHYLTVCLVTILLLSKQQ